MSSRTKRAKTSSSVGSKEPSTHARDRFRGRTLIVTGGAGNIGKTTARRFAEEGCNIVLVDLPNSPLKEVAQEIEGLGVKVLIIEADVTKVEEVKNYVKKTKDTFGRIDYFFNNAGYQGKFVQTHEYPEDDFDLVMDVNVKGVFLGLKYVAQAMKEQGGGVIVNTSSMAGVDGPPNMLAYGASKFAVIGLTKTAAKDLAPFNIRVTTVAPMFIGPEDGKMWLNQVKQQAAVGSIYYDKDPEVVKKQMLTSFPLRRLGTLEEVASVVAFLCSDDASYMTGNVIQISGGGD